MAAIREWYAGYGLIFEYMLEIGGEGGLASYTDMLGKEIWKDLQFDRQTEPLAMLEGYYKTTIWKDGGLAEIRADGSSLSVSFSLCPDKCYFQEAPYPEHRYGPEYCENCRAVQQSLARQAGYALSTEAPEPDSAGAGCVFHFARKEDPQ